MQNDKTKDLLHFHFLVFLWGFTSILGAIINLTAIQIVWHRMLIAYVIVFFYLYFKGLKKFKIPKKFIFQIIIAGILISVHWAAFFYAIKISGVSLTLSILASGAFLTSIIEPIFFKRKTSIKELLFGSITLIGLLIIFRAEFDQYIGMLVAFLATLLSVIFTLINSKLVKNNLSPITITFYELFIGWLFISFYIYFDFESINTLFQFTLSDFLLLFILGSACTAYAHLVSVKVMRNLSPFSFMIIINLEPVYAIILSLLIFGKNELMGIDFYFGFFLILVAVFLDTRDKHKNGIKRMKLS
ncbi:MAG: EamA family transporter [Flavobacteriaceae bacterium]|nr:EamA family transporter [Flavobacteriaceae bacterium]